MTDHFGSGGGVGLALRFSHVSALLESRPLLGGVEVHPEDFMGAGGPRHQILTAVREIYPVSFHGVGLSLVSSEPLSGEHMAALAALVARYEPALISEHLAWSSFCGDYFGDLFPLPLTAAVLDRAVERIQEVQERLGRQLLVENPSWYAKARGSTLSEVAFLTALARRSGCGVLLDVNNLYVSSQNLGFDPCAFIDAFPARLVGEIHLAGHARRRVEGCEVLVDDHGSAVCEAVWALYARLLARGCRAPAVVEWETSVPPLPRLLEEVHRAQAVGQRHAA